MSRDFLRVCIYEASQDHYLSMMIDQAATTREPVSTFLQPWA
ncbi:MAG: hypothetical protein ACXVDN_24770 [Ktedonobacteraceae bacterium]